MTSLKDILELPLEDLGTYLKEYIDFSVNFWNEKLGVDKVKTEPKASAPEPTPIAADLQEFLKANAAIVEKYKATGSQSLFNHLSSKFVSIRKCPADEVSKVAEELKSALTVSEYERKLLNVPPHDRAKTAVQLFIDKNVDLMNELIAKINKKEDHQPTYDKIKGMLLKEVGDLIEHKDVIEILQHTINHRLYMMRETV